MDLSPQGKSQALWCVFYGGGIIGTLVIYGLLQERIMTIPFGDELFAVSAFLVFSNRVVNIAYAGSMVKMSGESLGTQCPLWKYGVISLSNVAATTCQYECLKYVSFPVQMLGKSFKMMPVMLWGIAISGPMSSPTDSTGSSFKGVLLLLMFLFCDGLTSTFQEKLFKEHDTSKFNQMFYVNGCSAVVSLVTLLAMGNFGSCLAFCARHSAFIGDVLLLSVAASASQYFIYSQVKEFGALVFAATMNVRQIVSILVSYIAYHHAITALQSVGLFGVFGALFYKSYAGLVSSDKKKEKMPLMPTPAEDGPKATA